MRKNDEKIETMTFPVLVENLKEIEKVIKKINRRAKKIGVTPINYEISEKRNEIRMVPTNTIQIDTGDFYRKVEVTLVDITLDKIEVKMEGWRFLVSVDYDPATKTSVFKTIDDSVKIPNEYRDMGNDCEHCQTKRFRKKLFIVYHDETHEFKQVGSTCIGSFLGVSPQRVLLNADVIDLMRRLPAGEESEYFNDGNEYVEPICSVDFFMKTVAALILDHGYVSGKEAYNSYDNVVATGQGALNWIFTTYKQMQYFSEKDWEYYNKYVKNVEEYKEAVELAENAIEWVNNISTEKINDSDYFYNLHTVIVGREYVTFKTANIAASAIVVYMKAQEMEIKEREARKGLNNEYFGEVKERLEVTATVIRVHSFDGHYGTTHIHTFRTEDGHCMVWFSSGKRLVEGVKYVGKATVKNHKEYKGTKQTIVTRCAMKEVE